MQVVTHLTMILQVAYNRGHIDCQQKDSVMVSKLADLMTDLEEEAVLKLAEELLTQGQPPLSIVEQCRDGLSRVGERFAQKEYFLAELVMAAEIFREVMALVQPHLGASEGKGVLATIVMGTVKGDIHDMGKNIVASLLSASGFRVIDAGVDVSPSVFVDRVKESGASILGLSALLTTAIPWMKATIEALNASGLRSRLKVMVGGAVVNQRVAESVGADFYGSDAIKAVDFCRRASGGGSAA